MYNLAPSRYADNVKTKIFHIGRALLQETLGCKTLENHSHAAIRSCLPPTNAEPTPTVTLVRPTSIPSDALQSL